MLDKASILAAEDLTRETIEVPEWGGSVCVRALMGAERDEFEAKCLDARKGERVEMRGLRVALLISTLCDEDGQPLFAPDDAAALAGKSGAVIERLFEVAQRLSGLGDEDVQALVGNSERDRSDGSGSS